MNRFKNPLRVNGAVLGGVVLLALVGDAFQMGDLLLALGTAMLLLAPVNLIIGMVRNRNKQPDGMGFIISAGLLLLIGFSTCGAGFSMSNINFQ